MVARLEKAGDVPTASAFRWCCSVLSRKFIFNIDSQKEDSPDICGFFKALLFLAKYCYLNNFLKNLGYDDVTNEFVEIGILKYALTLIIAYNNKNKIYEIFKYRIDLFI